MVMGYGCGDVVALGRIETTSYEDLTTADDILVRGRFSLRVTIKRVLRGREDRKIVSASRIAHGQLVSNRNFLMVLSPIANGGYSLTRAVLWRSRPRPLLAEQCGDDR